MHNISPSPLQLFPAQSCLRDVCLKVTSPGGFRSPPLLLALRVPRQGLSRNVTIGLSQCVAKPRCTVQCYEGVGGCQIFHSNGPISRFV